MKVSLDTHPLYVTKAGVARYVRGLLSGFKALASPALEITELVWPVENFDYAQPRRAMKTAYRELLWAPWIAPHLIRRSHADLLHRTAPSLPIACPGRVREVVTLHDLAVLRQPGRFRRWQASAGIRRLDRLRQADRIICDSQFTADEAMELLHLPAKQLEVVHLGVEFQDGPADLSGLQIPDAFFIFVGSLEPGKNLNLVQRCYALAAANGHPLPPLLIVGSRWEGVAAEDAPPADWHYLGHQPDAVLASLYEKAIALLFPSKYEGFGFPPLEAMVRGCPVICGRVASLPEVGGDAAIYSPLEPADYLAAMQRILTDSTFRDSAIAAGRQQSTRFTWKKCAAETLDVYRSILK